MTFKIRITETNPQCCPSLRPGGSSRIQARTFGQTARVILVAGLALLGANAVATNSTTVNVPVTANKLTYALLANPYLHGGNTVAEILSSSPGIPNGTTVYKYVPGQAGYSMSVFNGAWSNPSLVIGAGEGFFLSFVSEAAGSPGSMLQINFTGDLPVSVALPQGGAFGMVGSPIDKPGLLVHDLGFPISEGDYIYKWSPSRQNYTGDSFAEGEWDSGAEPQFSAGEGFFLVRQKVPGLPSQWLGAPQLSPGQTLSMLPIGTAGADYGQALAVDRSGNVLIGGSLASRPFVAKRTSGGSLAWSMSFPGLGGGSVQAVGADANGNVFVTGNFAGTLDFGGGPITSAGGYDIFVAEFSPNGAYVWARRFGSGNVITFLTESGFGLAVDPSDGSVTITGMFDGTLDFGKGALSSVSGQDMFLAKFSSSGTCLWSRRVGGSSSSVGNAVVLDGTGNIFVTGSFGSSVDFGAGPVTAHGIADMFVAKYSPVGANLWAKSFGTNMPISGGSVGNALAVDHAGNVVVTGNYQASMSFGGAPLPYSGFNDVFLAKYSGVDGSHAWSKAFGGAKTDFGNSVAVDAAGNISVTGQMGSGLNFGEGVLSGVSGAVNIYLANFAPDGSPRWSKSMAVGGGNVRAAAASPSGHWFLTGAFSSTINFGSGAFTSSGGSDIFLGEFAP